MNKGKILGYRAIEPRDIPGYTANYNYAIIRTIGGCMNDAASPMAIADGAQVLGHWISRAEFLANWEQYRDRVIMVSPVDGIPFFTERIVKQFIKLVHGWFLVLRMYVPRREFSVPIDYIKDELLIIDKVME